MNTRLLRKPDALSRTGDKHSKFYLDIKRGLIPPPVAIGTRARAWPENEINAVVAARIAEKSEDEIRSLVAELVAARKGAS